MKKNIVVLLFCCFLLSCSEDANNRSESAEYLGKWNLSEILIDPGDGSGHYQPVDTFATLEFLPNGTISSNYSLCPPFALSQTSYTTPYNAATNTILLSGCFPEGSITYALSGEELILYYPCVEACQYKFVRIIED